MYIQNGVFTTGVRSYNVVTQNGEIKNLTTTNIYSQTINVSNIVVSGNVDVDGNVNVGGDVDISGNLSVDGIINITNTTNSSNIDSGALVVAGGVGIGKDVNIGGDVNINGNIDVSGNILLVNEITNESGSQIGYNLAVITSSSSQIPGVLNSGIVSLCQGNELAFAASRGNTLSSENKNFFGIYPDSIGIRHYNPITKEGDHVLLTGLYGTGTTEETIGGIVICPWSSTLSGMRMDTSGNFTIHTDTQSTTTNSGAFVVSGGVGIGKDVNVGGNVNVDNHIDVSGNLTIYGDILLESGNSGYIQFPDTTQQYTAYIPLIGEIKMYGGSGTLPTNYLWCNGTAIDRTTYSDLFQIIGTTYGSGNGSTTFNLPNLQQIFPIGPTSMGGQMTIGYLNSDGTTNYLTTGGNQTMNSNQLAQHTHNFSATITNNTSNFFSTLQNSDVNNSTNTTVGTEPNGVRVVNVSANTEDFNLTINDTAVGNINYTNQQESLLPPFTVVNYIIRYQ